MCAEAGINHIPPSAELEMLAHGKTTGMAPATLAIRGFVSSRSQRPEQLMLALKATSAALKKHRNTITIHLRERPAGGGRAMEESW